MVKKDAWVDVVMNETVTMYFDIVTSSAFVLFIYARPLFVCFTVWVLHMYVRGYVWFQAFM